MEVFLITFASVGAILFLTFVAFIWRLMVVAKKHNAPEILPDGLSAEEYYDLAEKYKSRGAVLKAVIACERAIRLDGDGQFGTKAKRMLDTRLPRQPSTKEQEEIHLKAVGKYLNKKEMEQAYLANIESFPKFEWSYGNLGKVYVDQGRLKEAEAILKRALEINPQYLNAWLHLASCYKKAGNKTEFQNAMKHAQELDPEGELIKLHFKSVLVKVLLHLK